MWEVLLGWLAEEQAEEGGVATVELEEDGERGGQEEGVLRGQWGGASAGALSW